MIRAFLALVGALSLAACSLTIPQGVQPFLDDLEKATPAIIEAVDIARPGLLPPIDTGPHDPGGDILDRLESIAIADTLNRPTRVTGFCGSACTFVLKRAPHLICAMPDAVFAFHGPYNSKTGERPRDFERATREMASYYPPRLAAQFMAEWRFLGPREWVAVPASDLIAHGEIRQCGAA